MKELFDSEVLLNKNKCLFISVTHAHVFKFYTYKHST